MKKLFYILPLFFFAASCAPDGPVINTTDTTIVSTPPKPRVKGPAFNADSAYLNIKTQVDFGFRIPGTKEHDLCGEYIISRMKASGLTVMTQSSDVNYYGKMSKMKNIMAQYKPERTDRVLILAHWDTRPVADEDKVDKDKPFDGADDGGSGTAVMLELARIIQQQDPNIGVDFLFVDAEDGGYNGGETETWCLGSQFWSQHLMPANYKARYGILLDMVAGKGAVFPREGTSVYFAADIIEKVWSAADRLGYSSSFTNDITGQTTDDHLFVNQYTGIPTIDIVHYNMQTRSYPSWHHTHQDNMDIIDKSTLQMVGNVLVDVLYNEMPAK